MSVFPTKAHRSMPCLFVLFLTFSCSKDSDLLADYVIPDTPIASDIRRFVVDDSFVVSPTGENVLDVLENDAIAPTDEVTITETSDPVNGNVTINEDETVTYTPDNPEVTEDSFTYTTEVVNEDQTVSTETGTVTVKLSGDNIYYVTTTGSSGNTGASEASPWDIKYAFATAKAGDIVYIKAGDYGNQQLVVGNAGTAGSPISFIGYTATPGDLVSDQGSTFKYGDALDANKMPLLKSGIPAQGTAIIIRKDFITLENIQISQYSKGIQSLGANSVLKNIIMKDLGTQNTYNAYDGFGFEIKGHNALIENCFVQNATAEAIKLYDSDYSRVNFSHVYADNPGNPTDYYFLLTGGTNNTIVENSYAERAEGLQHNGHGFDMKDLAEFNVYRNCVARGTSFELNFSGVRYNTIEGCSIFGTGTSSAEWHSRMVIFNGANNNIIKDMYIQDTWTAISLGDYDDGYVGPGGDRDLEDLGYSNTFENVKIVNTDRMLNVGGGTIYTAKAKDYTFKNCTVTNFNSVAVVYYGAENFLFENCTFENGNTLSTLADDLYALSSNFDVTWLNCTWNNVKFDPPN